MTWLITGGAGFIGSHVVKAMTDGGERVVVLDDLSTGRTDRLPDGVPLEVGTVLDRDTVARVLREHAVTGIVHIAGKKQVAESVERPLYYYRENVEGLRVLLDAAVEAGVTRFVFSSSAAVYGMPDVDLVTERTPCAPINPYGETKLAGEWLVSATGARHGLATASLRYFNVAGAATPELGDDGVFNLVPMVFERLEDDGSPWIFGDDYPTPDGTCVRDFIHVEDIASAHVAAARRLAAEPGARLVLNIGRGEGVSVAEMIELIQEVTGRTDVSPKVTGRRAGDPARVVAAADRIRAELDWSAERGVREMVESAWAGWRLRHP
ncbi:UDP-glucose 4-epimerase GalE [Streptomyces sp. NPDC059378]|uniref:UDP-glucose 4-epimerase GalE n=1 Tax=Streptomyces sp. NPDC059378 TaxID=3346815 RepID=UPI0036AD59F6